MAATGSSTTHNLEACHEEETFTNTVRELLLPLSDDLVLAAGLEDAVADVGPKPKGLKKASSLSYRLLVALTITESHDMRPEDTA